MGLVVENEQVVEQAGREISDEQTVGGEVGVAPSGWVGDAEPVGGVGEFGDWHDGDLRDFSWIDGRDWVWLRLLGEYWCDDEF